MSRMPLPNPKAQPQPTRIPNVVPSRRIRQLAERMIFDAHHSCGADAVLNHFHELDPKEVPALIGVLLTATKAHRKLGRPVIPLQMTPEDRKEAHRRYNQGERTEWVIAGQREYQRVNQRSLRARGGAA